MEDKDWQTWLGSLKVGDTVCDCRYHHEKIKSFTVSGSGDKNLTFKDGFSCSASHCCSPVDHPPHWWIYILKCKDESLYTGITTDLERRFDQHNKGTASRYTRTRTPVKMVYTEMVNDKSSALKREYAIKQLTRAEKLDLIKSQKNK